VKITLSGTASGGRRAPCPNTSMWEHPRSTVDVIEATVVVKIRPLPAQQQTRKLAPTEVRAGFFTWS
jgi:hypothetical protein